jgi:hypothetical protein
MAQKGIPKRNLVDCFVETFAQTNALHPSNPAQQKVIALFGQRIVGEQNILEQSEYFSKPT